MKCQCKRGNHLPVQLSLIDNNRLAREILKELRQEECPEDALETMTMCRVCIDAQEFESEKEQ